MEYSYPEFRNNVRAGRQFLVAGKAFGVGSSREMAPRALKGTLIFLLSYAWSLSRLEPRVLTALTLNPGLGIRCVIARSFAFIYAHNQANVSLLSIVLDDDEFHSLATDGVEITIDVTSRAVYVGGRTFSFKLDDMELALIENGGMAPAFARFGRDVFERLSASTSRHGSEALYQDQNKEGGASQELQW